VSFTVATAPPVNAADAASSRAAGDRTVRAKSDRRRLPQAMIKV
jgi:hypothetical protein